MDSLESLSLSLIGISRELTAISLDLFISIPDRDLDLKVDNSPVLPRFQDYHIPIRLVMLNRS